MIFVLFAERALTLRLELRLVLGAGMIVVLAGGLLELHRRRLPPARIASEIDDRFGLRERVASAYYMRHEESPFNRAIAHDAMTHLRRVDAARAFRPELRTVARLIPIPLIVLLAGYFLLPSMDLLGRQKQATRTAEQQKVLRNEAKKIEAQGKKMLEISPREPEAASRKISREMAALSRDIHAERLTPKQSLARLSNLSDQIQAERQRLQKQAGKPLLGVGDKDSRRVSSSLEKELRDAKYAEAAQRLQEIAQKLESGKTSTEERKSLAQELSQLSKSVDGNPELAQALARAAEALAKTGSEGPSSQMEAGVRNLKDAADALSDLAQAAKELEKLETALTVTEEAKAQIASSLSGIELAGLCKRCGGALCEHGVCASCDGECAACAAKAAGKGAGTGKGLGAEIAARRGAGPEWGVGATNLEGGTYETQEREKWDKRFSERTPDWQEQFVRLYDSRAIDSKAYDTRVTGQKGEGPVAASVEVPGAPMRSAPAVGVTRAFLDYRESQKDAIAKESIPFGYKQFVKSYFDSLEPPQQ
jgi:hypothetical protein